MFVAGGVTYSEVRCLYNIMRETKREIIVASTNICLPGDFLGSLQSVSED